MQHWALLSRLSNNIYKHINRLEKAHGRVLSRREMPCAERQEKLKLLTPWGRRERGDLIILSRGARRLGRVDRAAPDEG